MLIYAEYKYYEQCRSVLNKETLLWIEVFHSWLNHTLVMRN